MKMTQIAAGNGGRKILNTRILPCLLLTFALGLLNIFFSAPNSIKLIFILIIIILIIGYIISIKYSGYRLVNYITITLIYLILYPILFFLSGGCFGYMSCLFVYAIACTFITLEKKELIVFITLEIIVYSLTYYIGFTHPLIIQYEYNLPQSEIIAACTPIITGFIFGLTLYLYFYSYRLTNRILEEEKNQANAATEAKNEFFADINHELRTPVHVIMGMNEMILRESESKDIDEYAKNALKAGETLQALIDKLVVYSRIETSNIKPMCIEFPLIELIDGFIVYCKNECRTKQIDFDFKIGTAIPICVLGDEILLKQTLYNLLSEAINNPKNTYINFMADWETTNFDTGSLKLTIETSGDIISDNMTGINFGLSIIKKIISIMNGSISIEKSPKNSNIYTIIIPFDLFRTAEAADAADANQPAPDTSYIAKGARILVVDDSEINIKVISLLLKHTQIIIDSALNGHAALKLIEKNKYHLMLIDYLMPEMNGAELIKQIRLKFPKVYENTPIFALSANTDTATRKMLIQCGFKSYLPKPIDANTLEFVIINNIPSELIVNADAAAKASDITPETVTRYKKLLLDYDIILNEGLLYMSSDLYQYVNTAEVMLKNYEKRKKQIKELYNASNIKDLGISVHALKGIAKLIGAIHLYNIAMSIERKASVNDIEFLSYALPLLYYQWDKTINGIKAFINDFHQSGLMPDSSGCYVKINTDHYLEQLIEYTDNYQPEPALRLINYLITHNLAPEDAPKLKKASEYIEDLEYDDAMKIFKEMVI